MAPEIYAVIAVIIVAAAAYVLLARRERALPEAEPKQEIRGEERKALRKSESESGSESESESESESVSEPAERERPSFKPPRLEAVPMPVDKPKIDRPDAKQTKRRLEQDRYREGLAKTRGGFVARLARVFTGRPKVDAALKDRVEEVLFTADIGTTTAEKLLAKVTEVLDKKEVADADAVWAVIRQASLELLDIEPDARTPPRPTGAGGDTSVEPYVLLMIGVNGVGKTTTLGKLAARHV